MILISARRHRGLPSSYRKVPNEFVDQVEKCRAIFRFRGLEIAVMITKVMVLSCLKLINGKGYEARQVSLLYVFGRCIGPDHAQDTLFLIDNRNPSKVSVNLFETVLVTNYDQTIMHGHAQVNMKCNSTDLNFFAITF